MNDLFEPLDEEELDFLDAFLLERIDEDAVTDGQDEGLLSISDLDGLLTAVVSGPTTIMPSQWMPAIWGDFTPAWKTPEAFEVVSRLLIRHANVTAATLMQAPEEFEPMFGFRIVDGREYTIVDEWCEGYMRGVRLAAEAWDASGPKVRDWLTPIRAFTEAAGWPGHEIESEQEQDQIRQQIPVNVRELHAFWLAKRMPTAH